MLRKLGYVLGVILAIILVIFVYLAVCWSGSIIYEHFGLGGLVFGAALIVTTGMYQTKR